MNRMAALLGKIEKGSRQHPRDRDEGSRAKVRSQGSQEEEKAVVSTWIQELLSDGHKPDEIGVFVRSDNEIPRAQEAVQKS